MVLVWQIMDDLPNLPNFPAIRYMALVMITIATWLLVYSYMFDYQPCMFSLLEASVLTTWRIASIFTFCRSGFGVTLNKKGLSRPYTRSPAEASTCTLHLMHNLLYPSSCHHRSRNSTVLMLPLNRFPLQLKCPSKIFAAHM